MEESPQSTPCETRRCPTVWPPGKSFFLPSGNREGRKQTWRFESIVMGLAPTRWPDFQKK